MENVLYDYHIAKAMASEMGRHDDYERVLLTETVFQKHGITKTDFDTSMVWFARYPDILAKIYEKVNLRLKAERDAVGHLIALREKKPKEFQSGDSIDVWTGRLFYRLTPLPLDDKLTFSFAADTTFHDRDTLRWSVRFLFLEGKADTLRLPLMAMQVKYEKQDSVIGTYRRIDTAATHTLSLWADTLGAIKEVRGFIYLPHSDTLRTLWADQIKLMRYHARDTLVTAPADSLATDSIVEPPATKPQEQKPSEQPARPVRPSRPRPRA